MKENKNILKEAPEQSIPTPKSILNYTDEEAVKAIKDAVKKEDGFILLNLTANAQKFYNLVVSFELPDEDWNFELDKSKYMRLVHNFRTTLFTELSKVLPVINVNLAAFDFVKGNGEMRIALTVLISDTNSHDWVTGRVKKIDQKAKNKLLQIESKQSNKKVLNEVIFDPQVLNKREFEYPFEDYKIAIYEFIDEFDEGYDTGEIDGLVSFYLSKIKTAWYECVPPVHMARQVVALDQKRMNAYEPTEDEGSIVESEEDQKGTLINEHEKICQCPDCMATLGIDEERNLHFKNHADSIEEDVELDYEFAPTNVPGTPTSDEEFLECGMTMKEGKFYKLTEAGGLVVETVQLIKKKDKNYLFEKVATGDRFHIKRKDIKNYISEVKKK